MLNESDVSTVSAKSTVTAPNLQERKFFADDLLDWLYGCITGKSEDTKPKMECPYLQRSWTVQGYCPNHLPGLTDFFVSRLSR